MVFAQVASVNIGEGNVTVRFQAKILDWRHQEVRAHVPYFVYLSAIIDHKANQWNIIQREVERMSSSFVTGVVYQQGWHVAPRARIHDGRTSLDVALSFASQVLHLNHVATARACRGVSFMPALRQYPTGEVLAWCRGGEVGSVVQCSFQGMDTIRGG